MLETLHRKWKLLDGNKYFIFYLHLNCMTYFMQYIDIWSCNIQSRKTIYFISTQLFFCLLGAFSAILGASSGQSEWVLWGSGAMEDHRLLLRNYSSGSYCQRYSLFRRGQWVKYFHCSNLQLWIPHVNNYELILMWTMWLYQLFSCSPMYVFLVLQCNKLKPKIFKNKNILYSNSAVI